MLRGWNSLSSAHSQDAFQQSVEAMLPYAYSRKLSDCHTLVPRSALPERGGESERFVVSRVAGGGSGWSAGFRKRLAVPGQKNTRKFGAWNLPRLPFNGPVTEVTYGSDPLN